MSNFSLLVIGENPTEQIKGCHFKEGGDKFDVAMIGGVYINFFKLKEGVEDDIILLPDNHWQVEGYTPSARFKDIDFAGMVSRITEQAEKTFDYFSRAWVTVNEGYEDHAFIPKWDSYVEKYKTDQGMISKEGYLAYREHPVISAILELDTNNVLRDVVCFNTFFMSGNEEEFIKRSRERSLQTHALVKNGVWYSMGIIGKGSNEIKCNYSIDDWAVQFSSILDSVDPNDLLTVYTCYVE